MAFKTVRSDVKKLRDPFVLPVDGTYYMYGSEWLCYKSHGDLEHWELLPSETVVTPPHYVKDNWAPEVHRYRGAYYMFTTYYSSLTNHRGCTVLRADSPEGPFVEISDGHVTPPDWDAIDGTLYIDRQQRPWMVFVHEWTSTEDRIGRMAAARLADDLTHFVSEPIELFHADEPDWADNRVTDGCFLYRTEAGDLLMLWSNFDHDECYCAAVSRSESGEIDGPWTHSHDTLFSKRQSGDYDGGHPMVFRGFDGVLYLSLHSPNGPVGDYTERPIFLPLHEQNGTLVCEEI